MSLVRSSLLVGLGSVVSRILGFARDVLFAQALGAGPVADAFLAAFRLPSLVRRIVGEGGLNPALVPALAKLEPDEAARLSGDVVSVLAMALIGIAAVVEIGAGAIAFVLAPGFLDDGAMLGLVAFYTRLAFPAVVGVTLASVGAALLNMRGRFAATALAPLVVNGGLILTVILLEAGFALPLAQKAAWLAAASSLAGLIQLALVAFAIVRSEAPVLSFRLPRRSPVLKSLLLAGFPALVASGAVQLFFLVGTQVASFWPSGISWLYYAERVMQLPLGLMAALAASVLLPELALLHRAGEKQAILKAQNRALEVALMLALPAAAALFILSRPISTVLFERGAFDASDAAGTALVLMGLSLGLPFATAAKVLSQTLFARGFLRGTVAAAMAGVAATLAGSLLLGPALGPTGIALAISLGCLVHAAATAWLLHRAGLWSRDSILLDRLGRVGISCIVMSLGLITALRVVPEAGAVALTALCAGGLALYAVAAWLTGAVTRDDWATLTKKA